MAGFREFVTGEVLTASNVDDFLAKQAVMKFADSAARDSALGTAVAGGNALREGMVAYLDDTDEVQYFDGTAWDAISQPPAGIGSNVVQTVKTDTFSTTSNSFVDVTGLSVTITPTSDTSKILIAWSVSLGATAGVDNTVHLLLTDGANTPLLQGDASGSRTRVTQGYVRFSGSAADGDVYSGFSLVSPGSTSTFTAKIRVRRNSVDTVFVNRTGDDGDAARTGRSTSTITAIEVAA